MLIGQQLLRAQRLRCHEEALTRSAQEGASDSGLEKANLDEFGADMHLIGGLAPRLPFMCGPGDPGATMP